MVLYSENRGWLVHARRSAARSSEYVGQEPPQYCVRLVQTGSGVGEEAGTTITGNVDGDGDGKGTAGPFDV